MSEISDDREQAQREAAARDSQAFNADVIKAIEAGVITDGMILVVKCDTHLHPESMSRIRETVMTALEKIGKPKVAVLVLDLGMSIELLRSELKSSTPFIGPAPLVLDIGNCDRCGGDHARLQFKEFGRPCGDDSYWAICPTTGEPILMRKFL